MVDRNELHFLCYSYCCILAFLSSSQQSEQRTWLCALFLSKKCLQTCINCYNSQIVQPSFKFSLWISQRYWQASKTLSFSWTSSPFLETDSPSSNEKNVIPRLAIDGFISTVHLKLQYPSCYQGKLVTSRCVIALDPFKALDWLSRSPFLLAEKPSSQSRWRVYLWSFGRSWCFIRCQHQKELLSIDTFFELSPNFASNCVLWSLPLPTYK